MARDDSKLLELIFQKWRCFGYYGYGKGAAHRDLKEENLEVCSMICPQRRRCWEAHKQRVDEKYPALAQIRTKAIERARSEGRRYQVGDYSAEMSRAGMPVSGPQGADPWLVENAKNITNGLDGKPPDVEEN